MEHNQDSKQKYRSTYKLPAMEDSKMTPSDPQNGYGETTLIKTRDQLAREL